MIATELVQQAWGASAQAASGALAHVLAGAADPKGIDTQNIVSFFAGKVAPILLAVLGVIFIGRASKGEVSKVLTSSAIAIVGLVFIAGAATLFFVGDFLIQLIFE